MEKLVKIVHNICYQITILVWCGQYMFITYGEMN